MAKPRKADAASTTSSKKSLPASMKSTLSSFAKKAGTTLTATKRKASKLLSPKAKKHKKQRDIPVSSDSDPQSPLASDSESVMEVVDSTKSGSSKPATNVAEKNGNKPPLVTDEDRQELVKMMRGWTSFIYSFYAPVPEIEYVNVNGKWRKAHTFKCTRTGCKYTCHRYLDSASDRTSTGNMGKHVKSCWGDNA